jgi:hypothetical protein
MPFREETVPVIATLTFTDPRDPEAAGQIALRGDRLLQFVPSPALSSQLDKFVDLAQDAGLKWGTSLVVGLAALGTAAFWKGRRGAAYGLFAAAGLMGVGAFTGRRYARALEAWLLEPMPLEQVRIADDPATGGLRVILNGGGLRRLILQIGPKEFDRSEAEAFMTALYRA